MVLLPVVLFLAAGALAAPDPRVRRVTADQHKELLLIREREKYDSIMVKASAASPETMHLALLEVHEKSRRERLALRLRARAERARLRRALREERERIAALRRKK